MQRSIGQYALSHRISDGSYGSVWEGYRSDDRTLVAIRCVPRAAEVSADRLRREIRVLKRVAHSNITSLCDVMKTADNFYLVLEHCNGGDLSMYSRYNGPTMEETALQLLAQIAAGLRALHDKAVVHARLCPKNILLSTSPDTPLVLKISNFGNACILKTESTTSAQQEPSLYAAPEVLRQQVFGTSADVWSAGVIFYELLRGMPPFSGEGVEQLLADIDGFDRVKWVALDGADLSNPVKQVMWALLKTTASVRISSCSLDDQLNIREGRVQHADSKSNACEEGLSKRASGAGRPFDTSQWDSFQIPLAYLAHQLLKHNGWYCTQLKSVLSYSMRLSSNKRESVSRTLAACVMGLCLLCVSARWGLSTQHAKSLLSSPRVSSFLQLLSRLSIAGISKLGKAIRP